MGNDFYDFGFGFREARVVGAQTLDFFKFKITFWITDAGFTKFVCCAGHTPAWRICNIIEVPERGNPETTLIISWFSVFN